MIDKKLLFENLLKYTKLRVFKLSKTVCSCELSTYSAILKSKKASI